MRYYCYYPGCSLEASARAYGQSIEEVAKVFDLKLMELEDWNCCGSTPYTSVDELASFCLPTRNLALAEKSGLDLVTPCSSCYTTFSKANSYMKQYPGLKSKVDEALAAGKLEYRGTVKVRHILDVIVNDVGFETIKSKVQMPLKGLKVAPYYGCQIVRPRLGFDDPESPQSMDRLIESLGAEATPFPWKTRCCGGSLILTEEGAALDMVRRLLEQASSGGAQLIVTVCPLCQMNLDPYQEVVNKRFKTNYKLPVLFFTQLMGVALGIPYTTLGLEKSVISPEAVLAPYLYAKERR